MKGRAKRVFFCACCMEQKNTKLQAMRCCAWRIQKGWACAHCSTWHEDKRKAVKCCHTD